MTKSIPRYIKTIKGRVRALTGHKTLSSYAKAHNVSVQTASQTLLDSYNARVETERNQYLKEKADKKAELVRERRVDKAAKKQALLPALSKMDITYAPHITQSMYDLMLAFLGKTVALVWNLDGKRERAFHLELPPNKREFRAFIAENWSVWGPTYNETYMKIAQQQYPGAPQTFAVYEADHVPAEKVEQYFREGAAHCLLEPIRLWSLKKTLDPESQPKTLRRYRKIIKDCEELSVKYADGVPESALESVCEQLQIDITVESVFSKDALIEAKTSKKRLRLFKFTNTRFNHVELGGGLVQNQKPTVKTAEELQDIAEDLDIRGEFYTYNYSKNQLSSINTLTHSYGLDNKYGEVSNEFERSTGICDVKLDDINDEAVSRFVRGGCHYNATVDFRTVKCRDITSDFHIDMAKAYSAFKTCSYYEGFLGKITDFRYCSEMQPGPGMYQIKNLSFVNASPKFKWFMDHMQIYADFRVYPAAELRFLMKNRVYFEVVAGCWGSRLDFEFPPEMMEKYDGVPGYSRWTGGCESHRLKKNLYMKTTRDHAACIGAQNGFSVAGFAENSGDFGEYQFTYPKRHNYHASHITGYITMYQRLNALEQLLSMVPESLIRVCVDGIYYTDKYTVPVSKTLFPRTNEVVHDEPRGLDIRLYNAFRFKNDPEDKTYENGAAESYVSNSIYDKFTPGQSRVHSMCELHIGPGGSGKTHRQLVDCGLVRPLYVAPSYKLTRAKQLEYDIDSTVVAQLISPNTETVQKYQQYYNCLIIDEASMISSDVLDSIKRRYPNHKLIVCGDLAGQLLPVHGNACTEADFDRVIHHSADYRCKCPKLAELKQELRNLISSGADLSAIDKLGRERLPQITVKELTERYQINDYILAGTNASKDYYTGLFAGKFEQEKYYVTQNSRDHSNGEILISAEKPNATCEIRHSYTTHSIQGESVSANLYIDRKTMFCARMLYTAVSRAKTIDQIYLVSNEHKMKLPGKIYRIVKGDQVYIGSTTKSLKDRMSGHQASLKAYKAGTGRRLTSFGLLDGGRIELLEEYPCENLADLWNREKEYIQSTRCVNKTYSAGVQ